MPTLTLRSRTLTLAFHPATGTLTLTDRRNRKAWTCAAPLCVLHGWNVPEDRSFAFPSQPDAGCELRSSVAADGVLTLTLTWTSVGITFHIECRLRDETLEVCIPLRHIQERDHLRFRLMRVDLLPGFGAARRGQDGYFLLPNFCGTLCRFDKTVTAENRHFAVMHQREWEYWSNNAVFGVKHEANAAFLGIIAGGEFDAEIVTRLNADGRPLHLLHPCLHVRDVKSDRFDAVDRVVQYNFIAGGEAGYVGMGKVYRQYLVQQQRVVPLKQRVKDNPALAYELTAHSMKIFHAMKSRRLDGKGRYCVFTTFAQAAQIMATLKAAGIERASYQSTGWNIDGHDGMYPTRFPIDSRLGGASGFLAMRDQAARLGHRLGVHDNYVDAYPLSPDWDERLIMLDRDGEMRRGGIWGGGLDYWICADRARVWAKKFMPQMKKLGLNGIYYMDAMPRPLFACFNAEHGHPCTRRADAAGIRTLLQAARELMAPCPIGTENAFGFALGEIDYASHIVSDLGRQVRESQFGQQFADELVPFFQIAAHGLIKYHLNDARAYDVTRGLPATDILREIELGATPRFEWIWRDARIADSGYLHMGDWRPYLDTLVTQFRVLCDDLGWLVPEFIENHEPLEHGVTCTTYGDGTRVITDHRRRRYSVEDAGSRARSGWRRLAH